METELRNDPSSQAPTTQTDAAGNFLPGSHVIYAQHGRCAVRGIELRQLGAEKLEFYKLEVVRSALSRSTRQEPAIWLPVATAKERGLRAPMTREDADAALAVINSREYFFQPNESWNSVQPKLDAAIRLEGGKGLAKVISYLHVLKKRQVVPTSEVVKLYDSTMKLFVRELSELLGEPMRALELRIEKGMRHKLIPDT